jgi:uncharacterized membrane-anchored protein YhcB (DUF1043 family)
MGKFIFYVVITCLLVFIIGALFHRCDEPAERQEVKQFFQDMGETYNDIKQEVKDEFYGR